MADRSAAAVQGREPIKLFRVFGIQVSLDYSWFIVFALVFWSLSAGYFPRDFPDQSPYTYWSAGLIATLMLFFSILAHELSHSLMAIRSGIAIREIRFFIFGGISRISEEAKNPATELIDDYFMHYGYRGFPVMQDGKVMGVISLHNLKGIPREKQQSKTVEEIMPSLSEGAMVSPDISLADAMKKMVMEGQERLIVMRDDTMIGLITKTGLLRFLEMRRILER